MVGRVSNPSYAFLRLLRIPTLWWIILSGALHNFNAYAVGTFLSPFLIRYHGVSVQRAGEVGALISGCGGLGILFGGWACDRMVRRRIGGRLEVAALALVVLVPCFFVALGRPAGDYWGFALCLLPGWMLSYVYYAGVYATLQDIVEPALRARYRDVELALSPGPTGGVTALEILNILGEFPSAKVGWQTVDGLHLRASAVARAFRDRFEHLGDPAVVKAPWERLTSREYARAVAAEVRRGKPARTRPPRASDECTTHLSVIDKQRNMVALTNTAVSLWGSRVVVPGTGILLNNGMIWFDPEPGKPNSVGPGKRGLVNMVPALGFRRGAPAFSVGAPGGRAIISAIPQVISNLVDGRATAQAAVEAPRLHTEGGEVLVSTRVGDQALAGLARRGHEVVPKEESYSTLNFARPVAIRVTAKGLEAGCEQYSAAAAAGH